MNARTVNGYLRAVPDADESEATARLHDRLQRSRRGRRWERIAREHAPEIAWLTAVHGDVRQHLAVAVETMATLGVRALDEQTLAVAVLALDDLDRLGTLELRRAAEALREEIVAERGRTLEEMLAS